jgi:hypothetical protein
MYGVGIPRQSFFQSDARIHSPANIGTFEVTGAAFDTQEAGSRAPGVGDCAQSRGEVYL